MVSKNALTVEEPNLPDLKHALGSGPGSSAETALAPWQVADASYTSTSHCCDEDKMRALALEDSHDSHKELAKSEKRHSAQEF